MDTRMEFATDTPFEGILAFDAVGTIFFANSFFADVLDTPKTELLGRKIWDVIPGTPLFDTEAQGYSIWGDTLMINGHELLVARFPSKRGRQSRRRHGENHLSPIKPLGKEIANPKYGIPTG